MKHVATIIFFLTVALATAADPLVSLDYSHTLRIPNSRVQITVGSTGALTVTTESRGKDRATRTLQLPLKKFEDLQRDLDRIDWKKISADETTGLDGTSVRISYGQHSASLWSPDYNSKKRKLSSVQKAIEKIFDLGELDRTGMPR